MIGFARRYPVRAILIFGPVAIVLGSAIRAGLGASLLLIWMALVIYLAARWLRRRRPSKPAPVDRGIPRPSQAMPIAFAGPAMPDPAAAMPVPIPPKLRFDVLTRDHYTCQYCGAKGPQAGGTAVLEIDHRLPVARGGTNDPVNLVTSCAECNRGKGATRIDGADDPGRTLRDHQWETCRVSVQMSGVENRQSITVSATRYGSGKSYFIVKPKRFAFQVSLPPGSIRRLPTLEAYTLMLKDKDRWALQNFLDQVNAKLTQDGWQQTAQREWRRVVR